MPLMKFKPTSAGRRSWSRGHARLHRGRRRMAALVEKQGKDRRRNQQPASPPATSAVASSITASSTSSATGGIPARVERIEYDPNRTAHIALLCYVDGERRYIISRPRAEGRRRVIAGGNARSRPATPAAAQHRSVPRALHR